MKQILTFLLLLFNLHIFGQISGVVVDALTEEGIANVRGLKYLFYAMRYLIDDYVTFTNNNNNSYTSKIEFGLVKGVVSSNPIDGVRFLLGGRTTAVLSGYSFIQGYVAKGLRNNKWYYSAKYTYSFENNENVGLRFVTPEGNVVDQVRAPELPTSLRYAIGEKYLINKTVRYSINQDVTIFGLSHSYAIPHFCGGEYLSNMSEFSVLHRLWLKSFGYADIFVKGSIQWNKVPFPLLIMPKTNLSWIAQHNAHTFMLMDDMEFLTDREFMWDISWSANGKIFNRIPLLKKLKLREYIGFKGMLGRLTDKH